MFYTMFWLMSGVGIPVEWFSVIYISLELVKIRHEHFQMIPIILALGTFSTLP